jgi:hypothetical protein
VGGRQLALKARLENFVARRVSGWERSFVEIG